MGFSMVGHSRRVGPVRGSRDGFEPRIAHPKRVIGRESLHKPLKRLDSRMDMVRQGRGFAGADRRQGAANRRKSGAKRRKAAPEAAPGAASFRVEAGPA
jgi:hypothetical protein